ncbi:hypothetical protein RI367_001416 [Sorochytrium milnesiophthora]
MGNHTSKYELLSLMPQQKPFAVCSPHFCMPTETRLSIQEKVSWSGDDFKVKDASGTVWFWCDGKAFSLVRDKKVLLDASGQPVLNIKDRISFPHKGFSIYVGGHSERKVAHISQKMQMTGATILIDVTLLDGRQTQLVIKGSYAAFSAFIFAGHPRSGGQLLAKISRQPSIFGTILERDRYVLQVAPGVDVAFMVALCIVLDEAERDGDKVGSTV